MMRLGSARDDAARSLGKYGTTRKERRESYPPRNHKGPRLISDLDPASCGVAGSHERSRDLEA